MKQLFAILVVLTIVSYSNAQTQLYSYSFSIDTVSNFENSKDVLTSIEQVFDMRLKRISGNHMFDVKSEHNVSKADFKLLVAPLGYDVTSFEKGKTTTTVVDSKTNPGGTNCSSASIVCSNDSFEGTASDFGTQELFSSNRGCLTGEHQSSWYEINIASGGSLSMLIDPQNNNDDYDFAIWGPFTASTAAANCPPNSAPIRCSYSADLDLTGMQSSFYGQVSSAGCGFLWLYPCYGTVNVTDVSESSSGDSYVAPLNTNAGEIYIMVIDNFSNSGNPYQLTWGGSAVLDCTPVILPVELTDFSGVDKFGRNVLNWTTASEHQNDYFFLERSSDLKEWEMIGKVSGAGDSEVEQHYAFLDTEYSKGINYYRLSQVDYNGGIRKFKTISIDNTSSARTVLKVMDFTGREVSEDYTGPKIIVYSDGTTVRTIPVE